MRRSSVAPTPAVSAALVGVLAFHWCHRQISADSAARVAARRDGGPDTGVRIDPCRDDGDRRRVPGRAYGGHLHPRTRSECFDRHHRRGYGILCRDDRAGADRYQKSACLFDDLAARPDVRRARRRRLRRRDLSSVHSRVLQSVPVPRRRQRDPRAQWRAGHPQDGRSCAQDSDYVRDFRDCYRLRSRACRRLPVFSRRTRSCGSRSRAARGQRCCLQWRRQPRC